jgi:serine/threonine protein phosphatase PrpC
MSPSLEIDYQHWPVEAGEVYLLATDGVYDHLDAAAVHAVLATHASDLDAAAQALVQLALERGSTDNLTVAAGTGGRAAGRTADQLPAHRAQLPLPPALHAAHALRRLHPRA